MPGRLSWRLFFVVSALLLPIGGFQYPDGTMAEMLAHPAWVRAHIFMWPDSPLCWAASLFFDQTARCPRRLGGGFGSP